MYVNYRCLYCFRLTQALGDIQSSSHSRTETGGCPQPSCPFGRSWTNVKPWEYDTKKLNFLRVCSFGGLTKLNRRCKGSTVPRSDSALEETKAPLVRVAPKEVRVEQGNQVPQRCARGDPSRVQDHARPRHFSVRSLYERRLASLVLHRSAYCYLVPTATSSSRSLSIPATQCRSPAPSAGKLTREMSL